MDYLYVTHLARARAAELRGDLPTPEPYRFRASKRTLVRAKLAALLRGLAAKLEPSPQREVSPNAS